MNAENSQEVLQIFRDQWGLSKAVIPPKN